MKQPLQANMAGFYGQPASVFALYDDAGRLTVAVSRDLHRPRREGCLVIGNVPGLEQDVGFSDADIRAAIGAWQGLRFDQADDGGVRLAYSDRARRCDPSNVIEPDGLSAERGRQYRLQETASNEHVGVLACCLWAYRAGQRENVVDEAQSLASSLIGGRVVTVPGLAPWETNPVYVHGFQVDQRAASAYWDMRDR